ncbi:YfbK domain-containing protein [Flavobacterium rhizosphaerae]|uniref:von Willebrand factor type A domain-containing protein n=1 Tax=Flavobacterium rhizosphaerae TaxID=3163298 RepID=A0ABW8YX06_9FLAO
MEHQDKLYKQFEEAARKAEEKSFGRADAIWNRVEEKLDSHEQKRTAVRWRYISIAALFALFITIGYVFMYQNNSAITPEGNPNNNITVIDTQKIIEEFSPEKAKKQVVVNTDSTDSDIVKNKQEITFTATVTNSAGLPIKDAKVFVNKNKVALTNKNGKLTVNTIIGDTLKIQYKGMIGKSIVANKSNLYNNVVLADDGLYTKSGNKNFNNGYLASVEKDSKNQLTYSGTVIDETGTPFPGVKVIIKNTGNSTITDFDGNFSIQAHKDDIISIALNGYKTQEIKLSDQLVLNISMLPEEVSLSEVVVEGYFSTSKAKAAAAVTNVKTEVVNDFNYYRGRVYNNQENGFVNSDKETTQNRPNVSFIQSLQGQVPGLNISTGSGSPQGNSIKIRGVASVKGGTDPLYIIDGVPVSFTALKILDNDDIESINVLKEAELTAIYGSRGSNGVVLIKTKMNKRQRRKFFKKVEKERENNSTTENVPHKIPIDNEEYEAFEENKFQNPATNPLSTFSIDVDNASYTNIRRFINNGQTVPKDAVRVEEMINFFKYQYPQPEGEDPFSINTEYTVCPWNPQHKLLKIGLKGKEIHKRELPASNFVFLIDVSGSMIAKNKLPLLKDSMKMLVGKMRGKDRIAIVIYAGTAEVLLPSTTGYDEKIILEAINSLEADGTTAGGDGIKLAYETAEENFIEGGNNRVILATDGDFNIGPSSDKEMEDLIVEKRKTGVFLTCLGYGMGNYKDSKLETLADKGNGNYAYIDNEDEAKRFLKKGFYGSMYTIAKDVKIQIEFNPKHVQSYRLIGYENRKLQDEDFTNDNIDAGELGSGHTVTALYEIIPVGIKSPYFTPNPDLKYSQPAKLATMYNEELATIKFRYKKPDADYSKEIVKIIPDKQVALNNASTDFKFAAAVAWFGLKLRDSNLVPNKSTYSIINLAKEGLKDDPNGYRAEFIKLATQLE